ncbi:MAG: hypothetical protein JJE47_03360 [Acidimicrobiia bacterium]|nr:hypothetical protein [Acidimicrobiia bacterium]
MDTPQIMIGVEVPLLGDERRKNWAKVVDFVDPSKQGGWAFEGDFVATGGIQDVPLGAVLLIYGEKGRADHPQIEAHVYRANGDGTLSLHATAKGKAWARTLRDRVIEVLDHTSEVEQIVWGPELERYMDEALAEELIRRGWTVQKGT